MVNHEELQKLKKAKILIIDDEPINIDVVQAFLEEDGYVDFITVEDSTQAMDVLIDNRPDLILLDLMMPEVSGFDILTAVRSHSKFQHLPVIILTAATDTSNKLKALELGATDFLAKPLDQSELLLRVRNTLAAKAYQDQLAFYDPLTKLPNRHLFLEELSRAVDASIRFADQVVLLNVEIDHFNSIKDTVGIQNSDMILKLTAQRIENVIRSTDFVGASSANIASEINLFHFDSYVFTVLLTRLEHAENAAVVAERILREIKIPISLADQELGLTASIGIASCPTDSNQVSELLLSASSAKDYAKKMGGSRLQFSSSAISTMYEKRLATESKLRKSIANNELVLYYQPQVSIATGEIIGSEALIRWHSDGKLVPPNEFIPLAEDTGLIIPIGLWCLKEGFEQLKRWHKQFNKPLQLSINLSAKQFSDATFMSSIKKLVVQSKIDPTLITLELTESLLMDDVDKKLQELQKLRQIGFKISIDDFGTGYSSLSYLRQFPVDELKIDRSFIQEVIQHRESRAIVSTIVYLAKNLQLKTVAEGIEQTGELDFVAEVKCDEYQGFLFSRPIPAAQFEELYMRNIKG